MASNRRLVSTVTLAVSVSRSGSAAPASTASLRSLTRVGWGTAMPHCSPRLPSWHWHAHQQIRLLMSTATRHTSGSRPRTIDVLGATARRGAREAQRVLIGWGGGLGIGILSTGVLWAVAWSTLAEDERSRASVVEAREDSEVLPPVESESSSSAASWVKTGLAAVAGGCVAGGITLAAVAVAPVVLPAAATAASFVGATTAAANIGTAAAAVALYGGPVSAGVATVGALVATGEAGTDEPESLVDAVVSGAEVGLSLGSTAVTLGAAAVAGEAVKGAVHDIGTKVSGSGQVDVGTRSRSSKYGSATRSVNRDLDQGKVGAKNNRHIRQAYEKKLEKHGHTPSEIGTRMKQKDAGHLTARNKGGKNEDANYMVEDRHDNRAHKDKPVPLGEQLRAGRITKEEYMKLKNR